MKFKIGDEVVVNGNSVGKIIDFDSQGNYKIDFNNGSRRWSEECSIIFGSYSNVTSVAGCTGEFSPPCFQQGIKMEKKMKVEDLKVGMVFDDGFWLDCEIKRYAKIFKITEKNILFFYFIENSERLYCSSKSKEHFLKDAIELIDKAPAKIVEVEEEVSVYIKKEDFDMLIDGIPVNGLHEDYPVISIHHDHINPGHHRVDVVELCKIKRIIKKELNFNWDTGGFE